MGTKFKFETVLPIDYNFNTNVELRMDMFKKIRINVEKFGSLEKFREQHIEEIIALRRRFETHVQEFAIKRIQLQFLDDIISGKVKMVTNVGSVDSPK